MRLEFTSLTTLLLFASCAGREAPTEALNPKKVRILVQSSAAKDAAAQLERLKKGLAEAVIWHLDPKEETWTSFEWKKIEGESREKMIRHLQQATFSENAGDYYWLDMSYKDGAARGQGYLVIALPKETIAYVRRATAVAKNGLGAVDIKDFDAERKVFKRENRAFEGIFLPVPYKDFMK